MAGASMTSFKLSGPRHRHDEQSYSLQRQDKG